jgi:hypothetical protein
MRWWLSVSELNRSHNACIMLSWLLVLTLLVLSHKMSCRVGPLSPQHAAPSLLNSGCLRIFHIGHNLCLRLFHANDFIINICLSATDPFITHSSGIVSVLYVSANWNTVEIIWRDEVWRICRRNIIEIIRSDEVWKMTCRLHILCIRLHTHTAGLINLSRSGTALFRICSWSVGLWMATV